MLYKVFDNWGVLYKPIRSEYRTLSIRILFETTKFYCTLCLYADCTWCLSIIRFMTTATRTPPFFTVAWTFALGSFVPECNRRKSLKKNCFPLKIGTVRSDYFHACIAYFIRLIFFFVTVSIVNRLLQIIFPLYILLSHLLKSMTYHNKVFIFNRRLTFPSAFYVPRI